MRSSFGPSGVYVFAFSASSSQGSPLMLATLAAYDWRDALSGLWSGESRRVQVLRQLRHAARRGGISSRGAEDGHDRLLRSHRIDRARWSDGSRDAARDDA